MKKLILLFLFISTNYFFSQLTIPVDLKFNTKIAFAENNWVVLPVKQTDKKFIYGFVYFDEFAGYTLEIGKYFKVVNDKFIKEEESAENNKSSMKLRLQNLGLDVAILSDSRLKELNLQKIPDWLKNYKSNLSENEKLVNRASSINGSGNSDLALTLLEKVKLNNYKSNKFYFELAYAYNALNRFSDSEKICLEARNGNFYDELILKEHHYSLIHLGRLDNSLNLIKNNIKVFKNKSYLSESIINQINAYYSVNKFEEVKSCIDFYKKEIGEDRYKPYVEKYENAIKTKLK